LGWPGQARYTLHPGTSNRFYASFSGRLAGTIYECAWDNEYPLGEAPAGLGPRAMQVDGAKPPGIISMRYSKSKEMLVTGSDDGSLSVRSPDALEFFARMQMHDGDRGAVVAAVISFDDHFVLSAGLDGLMAVYSIRRAELLEEAKSRAAILAREALDAVADPEYAFQKEDAEEGSTAVPPGFTHVDSSTRTAEEHAPDHMIRKQEPTDISDPSAYSIQDAKLKVSFRAAPVALVDYLTWSV
jgi:hypothetical protein